MSSKSEHCKTFKYTAIECDGVCEKEIEYEFPVETVVYKSKGVTKKVDVIVCDGYIRQPPSNFYFVPAAGNSLFIKTRSKTIAQETIDAWCGKKNFYKVRVFTNKKNRDA